MALIDIIYKKAQSLNKTIVLPESLEERNLRAASAIISQKVAKIILLGNQAEIKRKADECQADFK